MAEVLDDPTLDTPASLVNVSTAEVVKLCAVDSQLFGHTFFPGTFRQKTPPQGLEVWDVLENPTARFVNLIEARGFGKTTKLRVFMAKRISYGMSRTILFVGATEADASRSINWLRNRIERNHLWRDTFNLARGKKWDETHCEILHRGFLDSNKEPLAINVLGVGMTGSIRGINFDDYRPDLIVIDDPQTDETASTEVQREKTTELILGAVKNSLAPQVDEPNAKMVMSITPQHNDDISQQARRNMQWVTRIFPCWTAATMQLPTAQQESSWPVRFPSDVLRADKMAAIEANRLSIFTREMECRLISRETSQFRTSWLNIRAPNTTPRGCFAVLAIDPVPPPSAQQKAKGLQGKDWETHYVWGRSGDDYHLLDCDRNRGHEPSWTIATAFRLARQYRVARIVIDAVAYQRVLKWILDQHMKSTGIYYTVVPVADGMQKFARITNVLSGLATAGHLWVGPEHNHFIEQFEAYGPTYTGPDDDLDASALALQDIANPWLGRLDEKGDLRDDDVEEFPFKRVCP